MKLRHCLLLFICLLLPGWAVAALPPFQLFIDITPPGGTLNPPAGHYAGPAIIKHAITIEGNGEVTIDGGGEGTVLSVLANDSVVRGLKIINSGDSHDQVDAGILVAADNSLVEDNTLSDVLFGVHLRQANGNRVINNRISSIDAEPTLRGEGIRMWYSEGNLIEGNRLVKVRDMLISNSSENRIIGNHIENSRISMEFVFSHENQVENNTLSANISGIVVVYSDDLEIRGNQFSHLRGTTGSAVAIKGSSRVLFEDNEILHCAVGIIANAPIHPENTYLLRDNHFAYNDVAMYFYGEKGGHKIHANRFDNNMTDILVSASSSALDNEWLGNYWDRYEGFDHDGDGVGDTPYSMYVYSDRLWMDRPILKFFRGSPVLELVDFVERLAPFSMPALILTDLAPAVDVMR